MHIRTALLTLPIFHAICCLNTAVAETGACGPPPNLPVALESDENLKGTLKGQAEVLSRLLGKAELGGEIEAARKTLYQNSNEFYAAQKDAYFAYIFCLTVINDQRASLNEKLDALQEFRKPVDSIKSVKRALKDAASIVVIIQNGGAITFMLKQFDPKSGRGEFISNRLGQSDGYILASDNTLQIASSEFGCSGSFRTEPQGMLRGTLSCRQPSGALEGPFAATIDLGLR